MSRRDTGFPVRVRNLIHDRALDFNDAWAVCEVMAECQGRRAVAAHHRRPRGSGGSRRPETNRAANGLAVCDADHAWIESFREQAYRFGWLLKQHQIPSEVPVLRRGQWVLLDDDGGFTPVAQGVTA